MSRTKLLQRVQSGLKRCFKDATDVVKHPDKSRGAPGSLREFWAVRAGSNKDVGFTMLVWCTTACYQSLNLAPWCARAFWCRCRARAKAGRADGATPGIRKMSWGFWGFSGPSLGRELDKRHGGSLQVVEKADGAGGSPGGVVRTSADGREYK